MEIFCLCVKTVRSFLFNVVICDSCRVGGSPDTCAASGPAVGVYPWASAGLAGGTCSCRGTCSGSDIQDS